MPIEAANRKPTTEQRSIWDAACNIRHRHTAFCEGSKLVRVEADFLQYALKHNAPKQGSVHLSITILGPRHSWLTLK